MNEIITLLIKNELVNRIEHKTQVKNIIDEFCDISTLSSISREEFQDFCFKKIFNRKCHANVKFKTFLNNTMPEIGFSLGYVHTKISVYKGLKWKTNV